jgi:RNA polymerase sigma factor (sigma-70 family)
VKALDRAGLAALVAWAIRAAMARAEAKGLAEDEVVSEALHAIHGALRTHAGGTTLSDHVRRRVRGALLDATKKETRLRNREVLFDDLEEAQGRAGEEDDETLGRALGVEAQVLGSPEESLLRREAQAALDREVAKLSRAERRLYELRHREGRTWNEIAVETGIPVSTARLSDTRIRDRLMAALCAYRDAG